MRIGIDARFYGLIGKGIGRYLENLIANLEKIDQENDYFIFLRKENFDLYKPTNPKFHKVLANYPWYSFREQFSLLKLLRNYKLDLIHFPHFNVPIFYDGKFVVTIHDLIHLNFNLRTTTRFFSFYLFKFLILRILISKVIKRATKILTVSDFTKNEILKHFKIDPQKIIVTYEGVNLKKELKSEKFKNLKLENKNYLLYVGNAFPHKNLERLFEVFKIISLKYQNLYLILVGEINHFYKRLERFAKKLKIENKVIFTDKINDEELKNLYQNALAYVCPSLMEGFGLPGLEAMAYNCPVVSSNAGSLPEIYDKAALYFDPKNIEDMTEKIEKIILNQNLRENLKKLGLERVKNFSWEKCARETFNVYKEILKF
jgi:glycosyltransferase involved in cell wall biosynthesis